MPSDTQQQRDFAVEVVRKLRREGHLAYWAGGCVRDRLLGRVPKDYDVATSALPGEIRDAFGYQRTLPIGAAFGVITVLGGKRAGQIEVATFRQDQGYTDGRHPDAVSYSTPELDAQRRDFTINGLFYDPLEDRVLDFVGGQRDLEAGIVRAIGEPRHRFGEDKLRMLRAVRFAATFEFQLDEETLAAIREMAGESLVVSAERIGNEVERMLVHPQRASAIELLRATLLLEPILPEVAQLLNPEQLQSISLPEQQTPAAWRQMLQMLDALQRPGLGLSLAALLYVSPAERAALQVGKRLRFTNKETQRAQWLIDHMDQIEQAQRLPWPALQRLLVTEGSEQLLDLAEAKCGRTTEAIAYCREQLARPREELDPPPLISGDDLIQHGLRPGKHFRRLLDLVRDAQLDNNVKTKREALELVDRLAPAPSSGETDP